MNRCRDDDAGRAWPERCGCFCTGGGHRRLVWRDLADERRTSAESAPTCWAVTVIPALRNSAWVSRRCSGSTTVTTSPVALARRAPGTMQVRLVLGRRIDVHTSSTSSTCTPRAAMSVATSTLALPSVNAARLRSRAG